MRLENLRNIRHDRNLSQSQLGSRIGVQQPRVAMIEGGANVTRETAVRIAGALLCDVEDLVKPEEPTITLRLSEVPPEMLEMLQK
jgi:transcriptional regulator with XRE-family HTH domain